MNSKIKFFLVFILFSNYIFSQFNSSNQSFVDAEMDFQGLIYSDATFGDYDSDGDLDILISGWDTFVKPVTEYSLIYRNDDTVFTNIEADIINVTHSAVSWADFNNDGKLDFVISGRDSNNSKKTIIYKNEGNDKFVDINANIFGLVDASIAWGDYDNDGDLDLLISGDYDISGTTSITKLYKNNDGNNFTSTDFQLRISGKVAWVDFDNDGDLDLSVAASLYENKGNSQFQNAGYDFAEYKSWQRYGPIIWGDYDSDGDLDILSERTIYRNDNGVFSKHIKFESIDDGFGVISSMFADMDSDGDLDIIIAGVIMGNGTPITYAVENKGSEGFSISPLNILGTNHGKLTLGDYDNDDDLDILLCGMSGYNIISKLYRNDGIVPNTKPLPPANLLWTIEDEKVDLKWSGGSDAETDVEGLSYNLSISSHLDSSNSKSPLADLETGNRFIVDIGNINQNREWSFHSKNSGTYYFSVQTIDNNYSGSEFSEVKQFTIPNLAPTEFYLLTPSNIDTLDNYEINFNWTKSLDFFSTPPIYNITIFNNEQDTLISNLSDTTYYFDGSDWIIPGVKYNWTVFAEDDIQKTSSVDTFSFVKRELSSGELLDSMFVLITNQKDSAIFYNDSNKLIMKLFWEEGAIQNNNDTLFIGLKSEELIPPAKGAENYSISSSILIEPKTEKSIALNRGMVKVRIYTDTTTFYLSEIKSNIIVSKMDEGISLFEEIKYFNINSLENWIEFEPEAFYKNNIYNVNAGNILVGDVYEDSYSSEVASDILVPKRKSSILHAGVKWHSKTNSKIVANGELHCMGQQGNPIELNNITIELISDNDSSFSKEILTTDFNWVTANYIRANAANTNINNCNFSIITAMNYSSVNIESCNIGGARAISSKLIINNTVFDSSGYFSSEKSIVKITNSEFKYYNYESGHNQSYVFLKNNKINAKAFTAPIQTINCFLDFNGNVLTKAGDPNDIGSSDGFSVYSGSYGLFYNNIISGFRSGIKIQYNSNAVIFNNTFINNQTGIAVTSTPDSVSIFNNIFYNQYRAIDLDYSTYSGGTNVSYIDNNLWLGRNPNYVFPYVDNSADSSIIIGNTVSYNSNPEFQDMVKYELQSSSPAIDKGVVSIPSFVYKFSVLDTIVHIEESIQLVDYSGSAPDLGANEYILTDISGNESVPDKYELFQNYPNPFNPNTTIKYSIPGNKENISIHNTSLKVYDILGREIAKLVKENQKAGNYEVQFDASHLTSGIYFYRLQSGSFVATKKLILLK